VTLWPWFRHVWLSVAWTDGTTDDAG